MNNDGITTTKIIKKSGSSLALNLTKELKALGLKEGDKVTIRIYEND